MTDIITEQNNAERQQQEFDDALHQLMNSISRPTEGRPEATELQQVLARLTNTAESNHSRWKSMLLALIHKRYHLLSPEAKAAAASAAERETETTVAAGDGERRLFYLGARFFMDQVHADTHRRELAMALQVLVKSAPLAGGSRDICALLVEATESLLKHSDEFVTKRKQMMDVAGKESLSALVGHGVRLLEATSNNPTASCLQSLLRLAADTLDRDLELVAALKKGHDDSPPMIQDQFPSTLHTFLPHCNRGRHKKRATRAKVPDRQVINSILEVMIWGRTATALSNKAFANTYERFLRPRQGDTIKQDMHILQTITRNYRKVLNTYARDQGYALTDQFVLDDSQLSLQKVCGAKAGDLNNLIRLARKKQSSQVLKTLQILFASNPSKITKYDSVGLLLDSTALDKGADGDELAQVERDVHLSRVKATVAHLRKLVKKDDKKVVVASMEHAKSNHAVATLVAAAMCDWDLPVDNADGMDVATREWPSVKLLIGGVEFCIACFSDLMELLDAISAGLKLENDVATYMDDSGTATTKAVQNLIDRHLDDNGVLLLITTADIQLPDDDMKELTSRGCSVHCHDADDMCERLRREAAERGDITISLAWDTGDDLDLHVFVPSGEEISYRNRRSADGLCILDVDMNGGGPQSAEPVENVFLGKLDRMVEAPKGKYKVYVQNYRYHTSGATSTTAIPFRVLIAKNGVKEKYNGECVGQGQKSDVTVCEFEYKGRSVPFPGEEKEKFAFEKANVVNLTASTGQTLESIGQLVQVVQQHQHLDVARTLVNEDAGTEERPILATTETLEVTNRDRVNMLLSKLPKTFHAIVGDVFGGPSLAEECAGEIARRMVAEKIPVSELGRAGYPEAIVAAVKIKMATSDVSEMDI